MKTLIILRHGKAEHDTMAKDDYDRLLTERGRKNARAMGDYIANRFGKPDLILASSAKRAHETAIQAAQGLAYAEEMIQTDQNPILHLPPDLNNLSVAQQCGKSLRRAQSRCD